MRSFRTLVSLRREVTSAPEGHGYCYLLVADTMFKVGATKNPISRITVQDQLGDDETYESIKEILLTAPMENYKQVELELKRAGQGALRFERGNYGAGSRETFHSHLLPLFQLALNAAESGNIAEFETRAEEIELTANESLTAIPA